MIVTNTGIINCNGDETFSDILPLYSTYSSVYIPIQQDIAYDCVYVMCMTDQTLSNDARWQDFLSYK
jgi:hypothetical protein